MVWQVKATRSVDPSGGSQRASHRCIGMKFMRFIVLFVFGWLLGLLLWSDFSFFSFSKLDPVHTVGPCRRRRSEFVALSHTAQSP